MDGTSRVTGDRHARFCERLGVKFPGATRRWSAMAIPTAIPSAASGAGMAGRLRCCGRPKNTQMPTRPRLTYCGPNLVLTMGSTLHYGMADLEHDMREADRIVAILNKRDAAGEPRPG